MTLDPSPVARVFMALVTVALGACQCEPLDIVRVGLTGRACRPDTGEGFVNGLAVLEGPVRAEVLTGQDGRFTFSGLLPGSYTVTVTDAVDATVSRTFTDVKVGTDSVTIMAEDPACSIVPPGSDGNLLGQICNRHTGTYVVDAVVRATARADSATVETRTDDEGRFALTVGAPGEYELSIVGSGYDRSFLVQVDEGEATRIELGEECSPVLASEGGIVGELCDPTGANDGKLVSAEVQVTSVAQGSTVNELTDLSGRFEVNGLAPGPYDIEILHPHLDEALVYSDVEVSAGTLETLAGPAICAASTDVTGRIAGQVCDFQAGGRFTGLADLHLDDSSGSAPVATVDIDDEGRFAFGGLAPGSYSIRLYYPPGDARGTGSRTLSGLIVTAFRTTYVEEEECPAALDECTTFINSPENSVDGRVLLVVDKSGSMAQPDDNGQVKWEVMTSALIQTTSALESTTEFGLMLYPDANVGACAAPEMMDAVPLARNNANTIAAALDLTPAGGTPTAQTMEVARAFLTPYLQDGRPLAVVLATDGGPNCAIDSTALDATCPCSSDEQQGMCLISNCLNSQATYEAIGSVSALGVKTYLVGVSGVEVFSQYKEVLNRMAEAGGAPLAGEFKYYRAENGSALEEALDAIMRRVRVCRVEVGAALEDADAIQVRVGFLDLPRDTSRQNGWDITADGVIELFGSACDTAVSSANVVFVQTCRAP